MRFSIGTVIAVASLGGLAVAVPSYENQGLYARDANGLYAREAWDYGSSFDEYGMAKRDVDDHELLRRDLLALSGLDDASLEHLGRRGFFGNLWNKATGKGGKDKDNGKGKGKSKYQPLSDKTEAEKKKEAEERAKKNMQGLHDAGF